MDVQKLKLQLLEDEKNDQGASVAATWRAFKSGTTSHGLPHLLNAQGIVGALAAFCGLWG